MFCSTKFRWVTISCVWLGLSACSGLAPLPAVDITAQPNNSSGAVQAPKEVFQWAGRFSVTVEAISDRRKENHSGRFELTQRKQDTVLELFSPLGPLLARLSVRESGATLELADRGTFTAPDAEMLLSNVIGWSVPVEALPKWLSAGPNDLTLKATGQMAEFDPTNRLQTARSGTWRADISAHSLENKPSRLQIQGTTQDGSQRVHLRLVLDTLQTP